MFQNWLAAKSDEVKRYGSILTKNQFGKQIDQFDTTSSLEEKQVAIIGFGEEANEVRKYLYQLSYPFNDLSIVDLGNLKKRETEFAIPIIRELLAGKIFPIIIGNLNEQSLASYHAFKSVRPLISLATIAQQFYFDDQSTDPNFFFNPVILAKGYESQLFHFTSIGGQSHFVAPHQFRYLQERGFDYLSLGQARNNLKEVEPFIRDADIINFHLNALKQVEAPGTIDHSPSGFTHEESCQLLRYAGMSDKLRIIGLYGYEPKKDFNDFTAKVTAQLIWYFLDGFYNRKKDFPVSEEDLVEYIVDAKDLNDQMVFYRSNKSGRWWMRVPIKVKDNYYRHGLIPCSQTDYQLASKDKFPDRLIKALQRFG